MEKHLFLLGKCKFVLILGEPNEYIFQEIDQGQVGRSVSLDRSGITSFIKRALFKLFDTNILPSVWGEISFLNNLVDSLFLTRTMTKGKFLEIEIPHCVYNDLVYFRINNETLFYVVHRFQFLPTDGLVLESPIPDFFIEEQALKELQITLSLYENGEYDKIKLFNNPLNQTDDLSVDTFNPGGLKVSNTTEELNKKLRNGYDSFSQSFKNTLSLLFNPG